MGLSMKRCLLAATAMALGVGCLSAQPALARTNYAVLVAVTAYPNLPPKASLVGPNHDAVLVRDYLETSAPVPFAKENVTMLADGVDGAAGSPTHERILSTLAGVAAKAQRDDFVYIHLSGHGAQQPERKAGGESDGFDEIFLPADTAKWVDQTKGVPNALVDDDIGAALDAIRNKGAFVWVIFDACHSGSATREAPVGEDLEVSRKLDFDTLGIPQAAVAAAAANASGEAEQRQPAFALTDEPENGEDASRAVPLANTEQNPTSAEPLAKGGMVAFFAAQTTETTPEMPLPKGGEDAQKYGLFTYTLMSRLSQNPRMTYRQLGHSVLQQYSANARQRPTPLFEGNLDAPVFAIKGNGELMQWPLSVKDDSATLPAGRLHTLSRGSKLAILKTPDADLADAVGYVEVQAVKNLSSRVAPVAFNGKPALKLADFPPNAYARVAEVSIDFKLKVARPAETEGLAPQVALVNSVLDRLVDDKSQRINIELVEPGAEADLRLAVLREDKIAGAASDASDQPALFFLPSSGEVSQEKGNRPPLVAITDDAEKLAKATGANLQKIFRATSLSRLAVASDYQPEEVSVTFKIKRSDGDAFEPLDGSTVPLVHPDDQVHMEAQNLSNKAVDVNILYVGSDYSISPMGEPQRLMPGSKLDEGLLQFTADSFGMERMIAVLTEAPPMSETEDLSFLKQDGVPPATRGIGSGNFSDILADIGMAPATRSAMKIGDKGGQKGAVMVFQMETRPSE